MAFTLEDLNNLDVNDLKHIGTAPAIVKVFLIVFLCIIVAVAGYFLVTTPKLEELEKAEKEEINLKAVFDEKAAKAANQAGSPTPSKRSRRTLRLRLSRK